jgi:hypothetical protein
VRKLQPSNGRAAKRLIMRRSQPSSGNGGSCDLGGAGGDGGSGGGDGDGGSGGVSCGLEAIRCQCSVAIDPGDAALQACKVGMQVSSWLLPPSPAPGKDIAKRLRDTLLLSRWVLERVGPRRESWGWDRSCTSAPVGIARLAVVAGRHPYKNPYAPPNTPPMHAGITSRSLPSSTRDAPSPPPKRVQNSGIREFGNSTVRAALARLLSVSSLVV